MSLVFGRLIGLVVLICTATQVTFGAEIEVLFLGDNGHHRPRDRFDQLQPVLAKKGIDLIYTDKPDDLNRRNLSKYKALLLFANIDRISEGQEKALLDYVATGGGFVPIHCATFCFRNSDAMVALMGAQFQRHGTGVFRTEIVEKHHPIMEGFAGFESWDETYVHHLHNEKDREVLSYRVDGDHHEPWTWVRTHGEGRVFYTAWGHDHRTWGNPGFQNLVERGIRWVAKKDPSVVSDYLDDAPFPVPEMTTARTDVEPFQYADVGAKIPNYRPNARWGTQDDPLTKMQLPLPAEESIKHFVVPRGFHVKLFAAEPDLGGKPIAMAWDERGRLWVAETYDYPNELKPVGEGRDRIRICEDTDGDWKADKFTVFADKLSIPTSITFHRDSVIVHDGTRTLVLKDTDNDDIADERSVLFSGWNQRDTHGGVSNFQYGLDNWIWAMQGYNTSQPIRPGEESDLRFANGFFRFRPDGSEIEFIRSTNNNTWGLGISEEGIIFGSTANRNPSVYMPIANRYYERVKGWTASLTLGSIADNHLFEPVTENVRQVDQHGGYTAGAGHALYTARTYPQEYWNRVAFVNGPTGHLVGSFVLRSDGTDFHSKSEFNLIASDDEWSAPIMSEIGPDGNVWMLDWYNYIVQHNPTPRGFENGKGNAYESDLRDKKHGRIYRIVYDDAEPAKPFSLENASAKKLVATLSHPNMHWRKHAQRLLVERGKLDVAPALFELIRNPTVDEIGLNTGAIHALWTLHGLGALDGSHRQANEVVFAALSHPSAGVRRNAVQVLPSSTESVDQLIANELLNDSNPQVQLAATLALADLPTSEDAGPKISQFAMDESTQNDRWLGDAVISAAANHAASYLLSIANVASFSDGLEENIQVVAEHHARNAPTDSIANLIHQLTMADPKTAEAIIVGLAAGWPADAKPELSETFEADLEAIVNRLEIGARGHLLRLAGRWESEKLAKFAKEIVSELVAQLDKRDASEESRIQAASRLIEFQSTSESAIETILERITPQTVSTLASPLVEALQSSESPELGNILVNHLTSFTPAVRRTAFVVMLTRGDTTQSLLGALDSGEVQLAELTLDQQQRLARHPDRIIRRRAEQLLERGGALPNADRKKVLDELLAVAEESGDSVLGKQVFTKNCAKCHRHSGEGEDIGPDLTGMAVHPKDELLVHILDPNRSVESNFRVYNIVTNDGRIFNGMLASESRTTVELFDAEGKKTSVLRTDIDQFLGSQKSLMPEGFEKQVTREELSNLLEFLTQRGSFSPVDFSDIATAKSDFGLFNEGEGVYRLDDWSDRTVQGVPFTFVEPQDGEVNNFILLHSDRGSIPREMPRAVVLPVNRTMRSLHLLSGVSGWGYPYEKEPSVSMLVRFHYSDGSQEDHELFNRQHFADYVGRIDVPGSEFAFRVGGYQMRYLAVHPGKSATVDRIELIKGEDPTAPIVMAATIEE